MNNINNISLGIIGAGNMATAIIKGILSEGLIPPKNIWVYDIDQSKLDAIVENTYIQGANSNNKLVEKSNIIILAVKPNIYPSILEEITPYLTSNNILISIAAGISTKFINDKIKKRCKVVRIMPNTPALVSSGVIALCKNHELDEKELEYVISIFKCLGKVEEVDETLMNAVTGVSGSGPAYVYMFIEALADGGVMMGLPRDQAYRMAAQTVLGATKMVLNTKEHPGVLKDAVCSPGGTTMEAVYTLEQSGFRGIVMDAVKKCTEKGELLTK